MNTTLITAPAYEPVTLAQLKAWARIDGSEFDSLITGIILPGLRQQCEQLLGRSIMAQSWQLTLNSFPCGPITLPWPKLQSVESVTYRDLTGTWVTLAPSAYEVETDIVPGSLRPVYGTIWPLAYPMAYAVRINYTAGYATGSESVQQAAVPACIKQWLASRTRTAIDFSSHLADGARLAELPQSFVDGLLDREIVYGDGHAAA